MDAPAGARRPAQVVADAVRDYRSLRRLRQREVAEQMRALGHRWHPKTVSLVESASRSVMTDELVALALVLEVAITDLLDPAGVDRRGTGGWWLGDVEYPAGATHLAAPFVRAALEGRALAFDGTTVRFRGSPDDRTPGKQPRRATRRSERRDLPPYPGPTGTSRTAATARP